ncbi:MAG: phosphoribosylamine--glycine ligase [Kiritimatiellia bacterium]
MKVLVIGGGGREHALVWKLSKDSRRPEIYCAPGNAGTARLATNVPIAAEDIKGLLAWAIEHKPDLTVVGPEAPLCAGLVDAFTAEGLRAFGPTAAAARLEGSKVFSKEVMAAAGVPTARAEVFTNSQDAIQALERFTLPVVVKADGLAAGKGVIIAQTTAEAEAAIRSMLDEALFGKAGAEILIEEFLDGEEASLLLMTDGEHVAVLPGSQDHKRVFDRDGGPNTGGMGAYSPAPVVTPMVRNFAAEQIAKPMLAELRKRGIVYKGILYAGLMIGSRGPQVLEFNVRFGDPETQVVLPRIKGDIIPLFEACIDGTLNPSDVRYEERQAATVVMTAPGYPGPYPKGLPIDGLETIDDPEVVVFHAGTAIKDGRTVTSGGRVLAVTGMGSDLREAVNRAYAAVSKIHFEGAHYRKDIAHRAFNRFK